MGNCCKKERVNIEILPYRVFEQELMKLMNTEWKSEYEIKKDVINLNDNYNQNYILILNKIYDNTILNINLSQIISNYSVIKPKLYLPELFVRTINFRHMFNNYNGFINIMGMKIIKNEHGWMVGMKY